MHLDAEGRGLPPAASLSSEFGWALRRCLRRSVARLLSQHLALMFGLAVALGPPALAADPSQPSPIPVNTVTAALGSLPKVIAGIGTVEPLQSVTVRSRVDGEVTALSFDEGQTVRKGDVLAQIDPRQLQAALDGALAKRVQDEAQLTTAANDEERYRTLADKNVVPAQILDLKVAAVKQLQGAVASDDAAIRSAQTQLGYATITAPITGRTGFKTVDLGSLVSSNGSSAVVTITQLAPISVVFVAPGDRFGEIRDAMTKNIADVEAWATDGSRILARGKLTLMDNAVDPLNGSIKLRATFDNKDGALWPGLPVATRLTVAVEHGVIVPDKALSRSIQGLFVYALDADGTVKRREVVAPVVTSGLAYVERGVAAGDRVVTDGTARITDGSLVAATDTTAAAGKPETP